MTQATVNDLQGAGTTPAPVGSPARVVVAATVLFVATVVAALVLTFRGHDAPAQAPAPAVTVTTEYYGAPAD